MAPINQNRPWRWLYHSKTPQHSLKSRLLLRIGILFIIIWFSATLATKYLVKAGTRHFLYAHTQEVATQWIDILSYQHVQYRAVHDEGTHLLIAWAGDNRVIQQGPLTLDKPHHTQTYIHETDNGKWIISSECRDTLCVIVGFEDMERRYAARRLTALVSVPLLLLLVITSAGIYYGIISGLYPLNQLAGVVSSSSVDKLEPIFEDKPMLELQPLTQAINELIDNLKQQLKKERQFLDTCAHELRTPVTALVSQIQSRDEDNKNDDALLGSIESSALRTVRVANQFLSLAKSHNRIYSDAYHRSFDICELTRFIISDAINSNTKSLYEVQMHGKSSIMVYADPLLIEIAIQNIIDNAFRYSIKHKNNHTKAAITINCQQEDNHTIICAEDNGPGVDPRYRNKLVERFYRAPGSQTEGAGLGLNIVNDIVEQYDGNIVIDQSESLGGFKITLRFNNIVVY